MRKLLGLIGCVALLGTLFASCDDTESYADMKAKERSAIKNFIADKGIKVITLSQFLANDSTTNVEDNEYVLFSSTGVYMQIVRNPKDVGAKIEDGETKIILARYYEYNIEEDDTITGNLYDQSTPDVFTISRTDDTYKGSFTSGYMYTYYGSSMPSGWLTPFPYIYLTRYQSKTAKVNLIVPHSEGTSTASSNVYPCFYQITFQPAPNQ